MVKRSPPGECLYESVLCISPIRPIACAALCGSNAWHQKRKETVLAALVPSAASCLRQPWLNTNPCCSDQYGGWILLDERFAAPG